jgi:hypothetical protein
MGQLSSFDRLAGAGYSTMHAFMAFRDGHARVWLPD